jgi:hypothetical protein
MLFHCFCALFRVSNQPVLVHVRILPKSFPRFREDKIAAKHAERFLEELMFFIAKLEVVEVILESSS